MEKTFAPTRYHTTLGPHEPVMRLSDGDTLITTTVDARGNDAQMVRRCFDGSNPQTGPFYIEGAAPGDTLAVRIEHLWPNRDLGWNSTVLRPNVVDPGYVPQLPPRDIANGRGVNPGYEPPMAIGALAEWAIDRATGIATLRGPETNLGALCLPIAPMLGCFGVSPKGGQAISTSTASEHGGNMDYRGFGVGATAYFPVFVEGALFFLGDGHALQADGEILGSGIEISMDARVTIRVLKGKTINWPRGEDDEYLFALGNARPLEQALQHATTEMLCWLMSDYGLDARAANILLGQTVRYEVGNVIDPAFTVVAKIAKRYLPAR